MNRNWEDQGGGGGRGIARERLAEIGKSEGEISKWERERKKSTEERQEGEEAEGYKGSGSYCNSNGINNIFFIRGSTCTAIAFYISSPPFPLSPFLPVFPVLSLSSRQRSPLENVTECEKLPKTYTDTVGHFTESVPSKQSLKK